MEAIRGSCIMIIAFCAYCVFIWGLKLLISSFDIKEFMTEWDGTRQDINNITYMARRDGGVLYGIYRNYTSGKVLEVHLNTPNFNKYLNVSLPMIKSDRIGYMLHSVGTHHAIVAYVGEKYSEANANPIHLVVADLESGNSSDVGITFNLHTNNWLGFFIKGFEFNIIVDDKSVCITTNLCKIPYNYTEIAIGQPVEILPGDLQLIRHYYVSNDLYDRGYIVPHHMVSTVKLAEEFERDKVINTDVQIPIKNGSPASSMQTVTPSIALQTSSNNSGGFIEKFEYKRFSGKCNLSTQPKDENLRCTTFIDKRLRNDISIKVGQNASSLAMTNLSEDGIVYFTIHCYERICHKFNVGRIQLNGDFSKREILVDFKCDPGKSDSVLSRFNEIDDQVCIAVLCQNRDQGNFNQIRYSYFSRCFDRRL
ncbi:hypothetical protein QAD02_023397 [Eretmocerus hayati]|uniref:Uncharacterized protein n=1 Tax=Eretmocerus hayati TaxID=131215 RepID=A0ACC2PWV0_9HYME|nr:hypothetical protein QAD02_023397 [Eretmocerus hayati]